MAVKVIDSRGWGDLDKAYREKLKQMAEFCGADSIEWDGEHMTYTLKKNNGEELTLYLDPSHLPCCPYLKISYYPPRSK